MINCADCVLRLLKYFMVVIEWSLIALIMIVSGEYRIRYATVSLRFVYIHTFIFVPTFAVLVEENTSKTNMCINQC